MDGSWMCERHQQKDPPLPNLLIISDMLASSNPIERMLVEQVITAHSIIMQLHSATDSDDLKNGLAQQAATIQLMSKMRQMALALKEY
jgi:hypothetical protein